MATAESDLRAAKRAAARIIREGRKKLGLTQQDLANVLGISLATVSLWEREHQLPDGENWVRLGILPGWPTLPVKPPGPKRRSPITDLRARRTKPE